MMNKLRKILFPFSVAYDGITSLRNYLYNKGCLESRAYDVPVICVGNLNVGGTGKSPMIEYLISILKKEHQVAVLSRGYKRKSKGFHLVEKHHRVEEVGDEPLQFKLKYPDVIVAVDANRRHGIHILKEKASVILLDDAFQHRKVKPFYSVLLTSYSDLYVNDLVLPAGNLRESKAGAKRANCIVVTKCPENLPYAEQQKIQYDLNLELHQHIYFTAIAYASVIQGIKETKHIDFLEDKSFKLVTGIANPKPLVDYLRELNLNFEHEEFADHHAFTKEEIQKLESETIILTTEKDFMRLKDKIKNATLFYLPISVSFLNKEAGFIKRIEDAAACKAEENEQA